VKWLETSLDCPLDSRFAKPPPLISESQTQCRTPSFEEKTGDATRLNLATRRFVSRFMPVKRPSEIFIEADFETLAEERRRFALLNIPRHLFSEATAATARRAANRVLHPQRDE
jgi:hypothetical protein